MSDPTTTTTRIDVTFGVDVPTEEIAALQSRLSELQPGSADYSKVWDRLKALHTFFLGRLEGECAAYMNIAKTHAAETFGV